MCVCVCVCTGRMGFLCHNTTFLKAKAETCRQLNKTNKNKLRCDIYKKTHSSSTYVHNGDGTSKKLLMPVEATSMNKRAAKFIHLVVCLMTGPKPLPKQALHIVRSRASSFK